jgi:hypothetical protein
MAAMTVCEMDRPHNSSSVTGSGRGVDEEIPQVYPRRRRRPFAVSREVAKVNCRMRKYYRAREPRVCVGDGRCGMTLLERRGEQLEFSYSG